VTHDEQGVGMGGVSMQFVWQYTSMLSEVQETFCGIHCPHFNIPNLDIVSIFENIINTALMQLIANEINKSFKLCKSSTGYIWCFLIIQDKAWN
jgi:hypothetical protein